MVKMRDEGLAGRVAEHALAGSAEGAQHILRAQDLAHYESGSSALPFYKKELPTPLSFPEPKSMEELETRMQRLLGRSVSELSQLAMLAPPRNSSGAKGYVGQLVELFLGAHSHNLPTPDFTALGIELKTVPVGFDLMPEESTFICAADINPNFVVPFTQSHLYQKLKHVLFVLILSPKNVGLTIGERRVLGYFFFELKGHYLQTIETDYNEFQDMIFSGHAQEIDGTMGTIVQLRPKAANGSEIIAVTDSDGNLTYTRPRGYYLRASFTRELISTFIKEQNLEPILPALQAYRQRLQL